MCNRLNTVSTDNLYIYHWNSALLEEFHYYPYGLTFEVNKRFGMDGSALRYNTQSIEREKITSADGNKIIQTTANRAAF